MAASSEQKNGKGLAPYLSPAGACAFALGTSLGWGSLVVTSNTYLARGGPAGSVLGLVIGAAVMLLIARNYSYLMNCYPDAGGAYSYAKHAFGHDHGFLTAWFLVLTYLAIFWANATSLPLFARCFLGDLFKFGFHYTIFGYELWFGETLLVIGAILLAAWICIRQKRAAAGLMTGLVCVFVLGITVCFGAAAARHGGSPFTYSPLFASDTKGLVQVVRIASISAWAFIGFENISHFTEEFRFPHRKTYRILTAVVLLTTALYVFVTLLSVTAYPPGYASWQEYIRDIGNLSGLEGLPAFYAARYYMGNAGVVLLVLALLALVVTSLIGNLTALGRVLYALSKDRVIPSRFSELNRDHVPSKAILLVALVSLFIPFLGRTAIGWIVDVTTIGAAIVYAFVSGAALKTARDRGDRTEKITGLVGTVLMAAVLLYLLLPNLFSAGNMEPASYILFSVWAILGFLFFRSVLKKDRARRFGRSIVVWIGLLSLILFTAIVWMSQTMVSSTERAMENVREFYVEEIEDAALAEKAQAFMDEQTRTLMRTNVTSMGVVVALFAVSLLTMVNNYSLMRRRADQSEAELGSVRSRANTDPLTGVKSKLAWAEAEWELNERIERNEAGEFAVVICDVNGLKHVNDTLGHKAGDAYIRSASALICGLFQHSPVYRIGGDEFLITLSGSDFAGRQELMSELHRRSAENIGTGEAVVAGGMSEFGQDADKTVHDVFERADARMYEEKQALKALGARSR